MKISVLAVFFLTVNLASELAVELVELIPLLVLDVVTSFTKTVDQPRVVVGKVDICDLTIIVATKLLQSLLQKLLKPKLDLKSIGFIVLKAVLVDVVAHLGDLSL